MEEKTPLVSVIIPIYQTARTLGRALDSALHQDYPAIEVVIVDDGSTDGARQVVEQYQTRDARICYIWQANQGAGSARNLAIAHARGEYLAFLDADDEWRPSKLRLQADILTHKKAVDLVFSDSLNMNATYGRSRPQSQRLAKTLRLLRAEATEVFEGGFVLGPNVRRTLYKGNFIHLCSVMMRRSTFDRVGPFMQDPGPEDFDLWMRASRLAVFAYCAKLLSIHYERAQSVSHSEAWFQAQVRYHKQCLTSTDYSDLRAEVRRGIRRRYRMLVFYYGQHRQPARAWAAFRSSLELGFDWLALIYAFGSFLGPLPLRMAGRLL